MTGKKIFGNKTWLITWANDRHTEIKVEKKTLPLPKSNGGIDYAFWNGNGKIVYNHDPGWIPGYIKTKIRSAFERRK